MRKPISLRQHKIKLSIILYTLLNDWRMSKDMKCCYAKIAKRDTAKLKKKSDIKCVVHVTRSTLTMQIMFLRRIWDGVNMIEDHI